MIKNMKKTVISALVAAMMLFCTAGCLGCRKCGGGGDSGDDGKDKPVAPETYSNEKADDTEPSLPYMKPWWKE